MLTANKSRVIIEVDSAVTRALIGPLELALEGVHSHHITVYDSRILRSLKKIDWDPKNKSCMQTYV